jgi:hypothetical protein
VALLHSVSQTYTAIIRNYSSMSREEQEREMLAVKVGVGRERDRGS